MSTRAMIERLERELADERARCADMMRQRDELTTIVCDVVRQRCEAMSFGATVPGMVAA